jgi:hypothetical protein
LCKKIFKTKNSLIYHQNHSVCKKTTPVATDESTTRIEAVNHELRNRPDELGDKDDNPILDSQKKSEIDTLNLGYIYLIELATHDATRLFKIGHTSRPFIARYLEYKCGSPKIILIIEMIEHANYETIILSRFREQFVQNPTGREYFTGNPQLMKKAIYEVCLQEQNRSLEKFGQNGGSDGLPRPQDEPPTKSDKLLIHKNHTKYE